MELVSVASIVTVIVLLCAILEILAFLLMTDHVKIPPSQEFVPLPGIFV